jgi:hypothetical protein
MAIGAGILKQRAENLARVEFLGLADDDPDAEGFGPRADDGDVLRVTVAIDKEGIGLRLAAMHLQSRGR